MGGQLQYFGFWLDAEYGKVSNNFYICWKFLKDEIGREIEVENLLSFLCFRGNVPPAVLPIIRLNFLHHLNFLLTELKYGQLVLNP